MASSEKSRIIRLMNLSLSSGGYTYISTVMVQIMNIRVHVVRFSENSLTIIKTGKASKNSEGPSCFWKTW